jgi:spore coat polysaccharide biosynthesis predicted glycosyltransferase SpsG
MRCLALAGGLQEKGAESVFVIRDYEPEVAELVWRYHCSVDTIPHSCGFQQDLLLTSGFAHQYKAQLIITDLSNVDTLTKLGEYREYLHGLKNTGKFLLTIDDLNEMHFPSDILVNPNYGAEKMEYTAGKNTKFLLGPAYFIFREEFIRAAGVSRVINKYARNILVTMGGTDLLGLTSKVARALTRPGTGTDLNLKIVLGFDYSESGKKELQAILDDFRFCEMIQGSDNMAELMLWADLAITAGGLTKYETAVTGTPSIIISQVAHQADLALEFAREGTALNMGIGAQVTEQDIAEAVSRLLRDDALRAKMSANGKKLVRSWLMAGALSG